MEQSRGEEQGCYESGGVKTNLGRAGQVSSTVNEPKGRHRKEDRPAGTLPGKANEDPQANHGQCSHHMDAGHGQACGHHESAEQHGGHECRGQLVARASSQEKSQSSHGKGRQKVIHSRDGVQDPGPNAQVIVVMTGVCKSRGRDEKEHQR